MKKAYKIWERRGLAGEWKEHEIVRGDNQAEAARNHTISQGYAAPPLAYTPGVFRVQVAVKGRVFLHYLRLEAVK